MKGRTIHALLSALVLVAISCGTDAPRDDNPAEKCLLQPGEYDFGEVQKGEYATHNMIVRAASRDERHIEGTARIPCEAFTFCDPASGEPVDSFHYNLDYPATATFCVRFAPAEVRDYECQVDFDDDCGTMVLRGAGIEASEEEWESVISLTSNDLNDVYVDYTGYAYIVGDSGMVLRKAPEDSHLSTWVSHGFDDTKLKAVWKDGVNHVYVAGGEISPGDGRIYRYDGEWGVLDSDLWMEYYSSIWGAADCNIFFGGFGTISMGGINVKRYDCAGFSTYELFMGMSEVSGISGSSASDVWAVIKAPGTNHVHHFDGNAWSVQEETWMTATLEDVWVSPDGEVFVVGSNGAIYHRNGTGWHNNSLYDYPGTFYGVWGTSADDVFVVGSGSSVLHYDGSIWTTQPTPGDHERALYSVWGSGSHDVWAVGQGGIVLRYR